MMVLAVNLFSVMALRQEYFGGKASREKVSQTTSLLSDVITVVTRLSAIMNYIVSIGCLKIVCFNCRRLLP
jgi:hypothetical protein